MLLEAVLYFVLGFLSAGLLALMISPAIWNRAVVLTKHKIESSVPLTLNEIQADKDQLRAEFAMSTRRLEMSIDELRNKASVQMAEIGRKRTELAKFDGEKTERIAHLNELEAKSSELSTRLAEREILLEETMRRHDTVQAQYAKTLEELNTMRGKLSDREETVNSQRIQLAAHETKIDTLSANVDVTGLKEGDKTKKIKEFQKQLAEAKAELAKQTVRTEETEKLLSEAKEQASSLSQQLEKRESALSETRDIDTQNDKNISNLNNQLMDEKEKTFTLEAKLATQTLKMEALLNDASNKNVQQAVKLINDQAEADRERLVDITKERDELQKQIDIYSKKSGNNWATERQENAILRERMNDMAAQITAITAGIEGPNSKIDQILSKAGPKQRKAANSDKPTSETTSATGEKLSLAARIRAIQKASGATN